jgi:hypothetical protein
MTHSGHGAKRRADSARPPARRSSRLAPGWPRRLSNPFTDGGALAVAATVLASRVLYLLLTRFVLDDALITARYGRNLAHGLGLAFNAGEPSYGFTSPAWVALSAIGTLLHADPHAWLGGLAIACDAATAYIAALLVVSLWGRVALAALLAAWPVLVTSSVGGMETSLLGLCAVAWWGRVRPTEAAALAPLVRPEGWLLVLAHLLRERRASALVAVVPGLLWHGAAWAMFGSPLPLSAEAKRIVYGGSRWDRTVSWIYHLGQLPVHEARPWKSAMVVASASLWLTALACTRGGRSWGLGLALGWIACLILVGAPVFDWYLALPYLLIIVSACRSEVLGRWRVGAAFLVLNAVFLFVWVAQDGIDQRRLLDRTWRDAAGYVAKFPGAKSVFAEAVGVLGWEFRGAVYDEIGIVTPRLSAFRQTSDGWYYRAVAGLRPDALIVRPLSFYRNTPAAGVANPFLDESQFQEIGREYAEMADFRDTTQYAAPGGAWVRVLVRRDLAGAQGATP